MGIEAQRAAELRRERGPRTVLQSLVSVGGPSTEAEKARVMRDRRVKMVSDTDFAAHFVGQDTIEGEPVGADERFMLGLLGDTFEEREAVFHSFHPEGEMVDVPTTDITLYRKDPTERFRPINRPFFESIASAGRGTAELAGREAPNILGEAVGLGVFRKPGTGRYLRDMIRLALGGAGGETAQQVVQTAAGTQEETIEEVVRRVAAEGGYSIVGGTLGAVGGGAINITRGRSMFRITPEGEKAITAAGRLGVDEPLPIQIVDSPALRLLGRQAQALLPRINRALRAQQEELRGILRGAVDRKARGRLLERARVAFEQSNRELLSLLMTTSRLGRRNFRQAGRGLQDKVTQWWNTSGETVDALYAHARSIESPQFDLRPALEAADEVRGGIRGVGRSEDVLDEAGEIVGQEVTEVQARRFNSSLLREIDKLKRLDPDMPIVEGFDPPLEVLREIRANLRDLTLPGEGGLRQHNFFAMKLRGAVEEVIENAAHQSPEAITAYKKAQKAAAKRFRTREEAAVIDALHSRSPSKFAASLIKPGSVDDLIALSRAGGKDVLEEAQDLFVSELARDPAKITQRLAAYDQPTLNLLLPRNKRAVVEEAAGKIDDLYSTDIPRSLARQSRVRGFVKDVIDTQSTRQVDNLFALVSKTGGRNGQFGQSMRAAIIDEIWQRSQVVLESASGLGAGFRKVEAKRLNAVMDDFSERGLLQFLTMAEKKLLRNTHLVQRVADVITPDAGTSIQAASAVAGARTLSAGAISTFIENFGVGKLMTGERFRDLLIGTAAGRRSPKDTVVFKMLGAIAANLSSSIRDEKELPKELDTLR